MASKSGRWLRRIIYVLVGLIIVGLVVSRFLGSKKGPEYVTAAVTKGNVSQSVSVTGTVEPPLRSNLQFLQSGKIQQILVKAGDKVKAGQALAQLEDGDLQIQLKTQQDSVRVAQANLAKALAGPKNEDINIAQLKVNASQQDFAASQVSRDNLLALAAKAVDTATIALQQAQVSFNQAQANVAYVSNNDLNGRDYSSLLIFKTETGATQTDANGVSSSTMQATNDLQLQQSRIESAKKLDDAQSAFFQADLSLQQAQSNYDKAILDYQRQQSDLDNNIVKAQINAQTSQEQLNSVQAKVRNVDVEPLKAQLDQAWDSVHLAEYRAAQTKLLAPVDGVVTKINNQVGETVGLTQPVMTMDSFGFVIKALVSEADIAKLRLGNQVSMTFDAFDITQQFSGAVLTIAPAETVVQGVVYYEVKIQLLNPTDQVKAGMTANVTINAQQKAGVLMVPVRALQYDGNTPFVQVLKKDEKTKEQQVEKRTVKVGLQGDENVEILDGLSEGENVITFTKTP